MSIATAHSMGVTPTESDWPRLNLEEIRGVLDEWGLSDVGARLSWHSPRPLSAAAIVEFSDRALFIKRHHRSIRTGPELQEEHRFIQHLDAAGAQVSGVVPSASGSTVLERREWTYEIHAVGDGIDLYGDSVSWSPFTSTGHAVAAGRALGALHLAAVGFDAPSRSASLLVSNDRIVKSPEPLAVIRELIAERPALTAYFRDKPWEAEIARALSPFHDRLLDVVPDLQPLWTHNDWHASNLLWSDRSDRASVSTVLDFGLSDRTTAVYDLATAIERNAIPWLDIHDGIAASAHLTLVSELIRGYLDVHPLGRRERIALLALLPLVHVGYALTEIDYFHGVTRSAENADLAYRGFLLGHCAWFESAQGRNLLEHLSRELTLPGRGGFAAPLVGLQPK